MERILNDYLDLNQNLLPENDSIPPFSCSNCAAADFFFRYFFSTAKLFPLNRKKTSNAVMIERKKKIKERFFCDGFA